MFGVDTTGGFSTGLGSFSYFGNSKGAVPASSSSFFDYADSAVKTAVAASKKKNDSPLMSDVMPKESQSWYTQDKIEATKKMSLVADSSASRGSSSVSPFILILIAITIYKLFK